MTADREAVATDGPVEQQNRIGATGSTPDAATHRAGKDSASIRQITNKASAGAATSPGQVPSLPVPPNPTLSSARSTQASSAQLGPERSDAPIPIGRDQLRTPAETDPEQPLRLPTSALEPAAALLGWLSLAALGAAGLATRFEHHSIAAMAPWVAVFLAGSVVSILLATRRRSALGVRRMLSEVQHRHSSVPSADSNESSRRADEYLSDLLEISSGFVGGRAAALYVLTGEPGGAVLRTSVGIDFTSPAVGVAIEAVATEARPVSMADDDEHSWVVLAAPLVIGDRVTGVLVVSAPRRWSRTSRLPRLQQIADGGSAVIERARLGEEEWRSRLGVAHARGHLAILAEAAITLSTDAESTEEAFQRLGTVIVPDFADWFGVHLDDGSGKLTNVSVGDTRMSSRREDVTSSRHFQRSTKRDVAGHIHPDGEALVRSAMATGGAVVSSDLAAGCTEPGRTPGNEPPLSLVQASATEGIGSLMVVPVEIHGRPVGALSFVTFPKRRGFRPSDLEAAAFLASNVATTAERAMLLRQGQALSRSADRRADRLRRLVETALAVSTPLSEFEVLQVLAEQAKRVLACERVVVTCRGREVTVEMACPPDPNDRELVAIRQASDRVLGGSSSSQASSTMGVASFRVAEARVADSESTTPDWVAAPVDQATGATRRAMVALGTGPEPFGPDDEAVLALLARMASAALERAALYETLRSNEQRLTALVESSPLAIAELDLDGTVRWWNRAAGYLFGWEDAGPAPRAIPVAGETTSMLSSLWERARLGIATVGALVPARRPDGELMELSLSVAPLQENDGTTGGILAVIEDATEREQVIEQFHRSQRLGAMARLAGGIAHDFSNLVTVILASSETLMIRMDKDDPLRADVEAIHRVGKRAAALTGQLLQIGHRSSVLLVETNPAQVIAAMTDEIRKLMGSHIDLKVTSDPQDSAVVVLVDPVELERAVLNLAFNARDAMPQGGRLSIDTRLVQGASAGTAWVTISVADTGIGMDPSTAEHCFEPFFTTKGSASGTGLGLATVHAMVTQSNGSVNVESTPGLGTTFTLRFPLATEESGQMGMVQASKR